ncbi:unnamed protein product [Microthlaspi erraticum]|uniref:RRM domain-containing protein n=1 Tax=Microthlaspi erraticum TaxID=1685480 RepID=A0A6D2HQD6_9BRAS|nr:unnamed protein product [Microthlaspi erraticum]
MAYHQPYDPYYVYNPHSLPPQLPQFADEPGAINTLFVSGLPNDVKAREIHNLFRRRLGFESCQLKYTGRGDQVVAFATFSSHRFAMAAMNELNGVKFDPQTGSTLHIEVARSNSRRTERPGSGPYVVIDNRNKKPSKSQDDQSEEGESDTDEAHESGNGDSPKENDDTKSEADSDPDSKPPSDSGHLGKGFEGGSGARPCSTLFIANLGPNCTEDELKQLLSRYPGFNILRIRARGGMPVAFADFEETEQATHVMNDLQGNLLSSSDRGGMHIEYARSKMRKQ